MATYDAVVVGARCAGSIAAGLLARRGWKVILVDKARFPSDTVSTHAIFPNTLARFEQLGILDRLHSRHKIPPLRMRWRILGYELAGSYTPIDGHSTGISVRRVALDDVLVKWALDEGVESRFGSHVTGVIGNGVEGDPLQGVILDRGDEIRVRWVLGCDGRASTVSSLLGLEKKKPLAGEMAYLFAYWRSLPDFEFMSLSVDDKRNGLMWNPSEDGIHLLSVAGPPEITRGTSAQRERRYALGLQAFPEVLDAAQLEKAERISDLVVVPETMMRGFYRQSNGPGWALIGDAGHFKHPGTAQGISDAVEQAIYVADGLTGDDSELEGFHEWRRERSVQHYEYSFVYGSWPKDDVAHPYMRGLSSDPGAKQDWLDVFTRRNKPSDVNTAERLTKWFSAPAAG